MVSLHESTGKLYSPTQIFESPFSQRELMVIFRKDNKKYNIKFDGDKQEIYQIVQKFMIWEHTVKNKTDLKSFFKTMFFDENLELIGGY